MESGKNERGFVLNTNPVVESGAIAVDARAMVEGKVKIKNTFTSLPIIT